MKGRYETFPVITKPFRQACSGFRERFHGAGLTKGLLLSILPSQPFLDKEPKRLHPNLGLIVSGVPEWVGSLKYFGVHSKSLMLRFFTLSPT